MNFQGLKNIESTDWYLDLAFSAAKKEADKKRKETEGSGIERVKKSQRIEHEKLKTIAKKLVKQFNLILKSFPSIDNLPEFYNEMIRTTLDYPKLKKSLGSVKWAVEHVQEFTKDYMKKIKRCNDLHKINSFRREYYGRISSILKQIKEPLEYLEEARKIMKDFPSIKTEIFTVAIAGFPNVGKSTLLKKITGADVEIKSYAFTTKRLNTGYMKTEYGKVQFIDTPGTLDRFEKMNPIEKQAYLAIRYCANVILYVFDLTETYSLEDQKKLLKNLSRFKKDTIVYLSKTDIIDKKKIDEFMANNKYEHVFTDPKSLSEEIETRSTQ